jgi:ribosomal protein S12 methylthiotransferase accessory factor
MSDLVECVEQLLHPRFGVLGLLKEVTLMPGEPDLFMFAAEHQNPARFHLPPEGEHLGKLRAGGAGLTREQALWSVVGECVERYSACNVDPERLVRGSYNELGVGAVHPSEFILFSDEQYRDPHFGFRRVTEDTRLDWIQGRCLTTGRESYLPSHLVYMRYQPQAEILDTSYSTGLAAGASPTAATLSALSEVVERDAFMCHWLSRRTPPPIEIDPDELPARLRKLLALPNYQINVRDITTEFEIPCVLSQVRTRDRPGLGTGASCHLTAERALEKALVESFHMYSGVLGMQRDRVRVETPDQVKNFADHVAYYLEAERSSNLDFLYAPASASALHLCRENFDAAVDANAALDDMVQKLRRHGYDVHCVEITSPDIAQLDLHVVRVVVPGLQPLYAGTGNQHLDPRRLAKFAASAGLDLPPKPNLEPHCFS